ncbi:MAG: hypothetical protein P1U56_04950 [Saprospiraceae bacterium]|nr:hypothetical protein [Saprospiraceae bacterium]
MQPTQSILCNIINQLHAIENKINELPENHKLDRRFNRIKQQFQELDLHVHNPIDEPYDETRIDCEASVAGDKTDNLHIVEVIKPIVFLREGNTNQIIQRGVVIVESK